VKEPGLTTKIILGSQTRTAI